jgi:hypothetical protein
MTAGDRHAIGASLGRRDFEAAVREVHRQHLSRIGLIVDDEDAAEHLAHARGLPKVRYAGDVGARAVPRPHIVRKHACSQAGSRGELRAEVGQLLPATYVSP